MSLHTGSRLGPYEIVAPLGVGGMGEVYRARDARLQRDVAIKVLPESFANDPDRLARFAREAQVLASLNHPHIAHVYGIEESAGIRGLVMELVEGPTLAERMSAGVIPLDEALPIARQIADALDAAHERGIVHRDLKPANIKLTPDGSVKVLDFGLAKNFAPHPTDLSHPAHLPHPTMTTPAMTQAGVIMGTAAYMSPEQARGKPVDKRSDIWSFGVILYEMLTGRQMFAGETVSDTIAELLKRELDLKALPLETPPGVRVLLDKCLQRDPKKRLRDIGDATFDDAIVAAPPAPRAVTAFHPAVLAVAAVIAIIAATLAWWLKPPPPVASSPLVRYTIPLAPHEQLRTVTRQLLAVAPDGSAIAIAAGRGILLRRLGDFASTPLPNTEAAFAMTFSADSKSLLFWAGGDLKRLDLSGGTPQRIVAVGMPAATGPNGLAWSSDGTIAFPSDDGITLLSGDGTAKPLPGAIIGDAFPALPHFLPDGRALLYASRQPNVSSIVLQSLDESKPVVLLQGNAPQFVAPDQLLFARADSLYRVSLNVAEKRVIGEPSLVLGGMMAAGIGTVPQFSASRNAALYYLPSGVDGGDGHSLVTVRTGAVPVRLDAPDRNYSDLRLSPDGTRLALHVSDDENDIWIRDMVRGTRTRLTFAAGEDETAVWSPDGMRVAYGSDRAEDKARTIRSKRADGTGEETVLWRASGHAHASDWSRDGRWLVVDVIDAKTRSDIVLLDLKASSSPRMFLKTPFVESSGRISSDGRWLAYMSDESGANEVYLQSFPDGGNKVQVSLAGGTAPVWSHDGSRLFYRSSTDLMAVSVTFTPAFTVSAPQRLFADSFGKLQGDTHTSYDVARDGTFLFTRAPAVAGGTQVVVHGVLNWFNQPK